MDSTTKILVTHGSETRKVKWFGPASDTPSWAIREAIVAAFSLPDHVTLCLQSTDTGEVVAISSHIPSGLSFKLVVNSSPIPTFPGNSPRKYYHFQDALIRSPRLSPAHSRPTSPTCNLVDTKDEAANCGPVPSLSIPKVTFSGPTKVEEFFTPRDSDLPSLHPNGMILQCEGYWVEDECEEYECEGDFVLQEFDFLKDYEMYFTPNPHSIYTCLDVRHGRMFVAVLPEESKARILVRAVHGDSRLFINCEKGRMLSSKDVSIAISQQLDWFSPSNRLQEISLTPEFREEFLQFEDLMYPKRFKVGVLFAKAGQCCENDFFNNEHGSDQFHEFISLLGDKVSLKNHHGYTGGLDTSHKCLTGEHSIYTNFRHFEIMFHISTFLPYNASDPQQIMRKRHIGNDVVMILFKEGTTAFSPDCIRSRLNHVFIVVQPLEGASKRYRVSVVCKDKVRPSPPGLPSPAIFSHDNSFCQFLLTKVINSERAAFSAPSFSGLWRARKERLINLHDQLKSARRSNEAGLFRSLWQTSPS